MIDSLVSIMASNVAIAAVLAVLGATVLRLAARPALAHVLLLLALLKLVTPPLITVPVLPAVEHVDAGESVDRVAAIGRDSGPATVAPLWVDHAPVVGGTAIDRRVAEDAAAPASPPPSNWRDAVLPIWLLGLAFAVGAAWRRTRRFSLVLRMARGASPSLQRRVEQLARDIGLRRAPVVSIVPARVAPAVFAGFHRPRMVLPSALLRSLRNDQLDALLTHELAHVRRGDHIVRGIELAVAACYWWLPLVGWLRRRLREAEEQCCDAWVVATLDDHERCYADALLDTIDFLAHTPFALPPQASGVAPVRDMKRRLTMIMQSRTQQKLGRRGRLSVLILAVALLPLAAGNAQGKRKTARDRAELDAALERIERLERTVDRLMSRDRASSRGPATEAPSDFVPEPRHYYTVKAGDTLAVIAKRFYGSAKHFDRLHALNPGIDPRRLRVGQRLHIGPGAGDDPERFADWLDRTDPGAGAGRDDLRAAAGRALAKGDYAAARRLYQKWLAGVADDRDDASPYRELLEGYLARAPDDEIARALIYKNLAKADDTDVPRRPEAAFDLWLSRSKDAKQNPAKQAARIEQRITELETELNTLRNALRKLRLDPARGPGGGGADDGAPGDARDKRRSGVGR